jgi:hypothetical protein
VVERLVLVELASLLFLPQAAAGADDIDLLALRADQAAAAAAITQVLADMLVARETPRLHRQAKVLREALLLQEPLPAVAAAAAQGL